MQADPKQKQDKKTSLTKKTNKKLQTLSNQDLKKLLQFILLNPHIIGSLPTCKSTINLIQNFIGPHVSFDQCHAKMHHMNGFYSSYDQIVKCLVKKVKAEEYWVDQKNFLENSQDWTLQLIFKKIQTLN